MLIFAGSCESWKQATHRLNDSYHAAGTHRTQAGIRCRSAQLLTVQQLVALGHGISLVPAMAREMDRGRRCEYRSLTAPKPTRTLCMIWHKARYQSPLAKDFIQTLRREAAAFKQDAGPH